MGKKSKRDDRGSAIIIVVVAMAMIGIMATTVLWASYLNYHIKINDLKAKNSFYSAETIVEQIMAGLKRDVVSVSINEAYQEVVSNWDALETETNRESYFTAAYIRAVEEKLNVTPSGMSKRYDKSKLRGYIDQAFWSEDNPSGHIQATAWDEAIPEFQPAGAANVYGSMVIKNIRVEFCDNSGYLSIINTDIAIDVPKLRFTQAGNIDRLYSYALIGGTGIAFADGTTASINGSIYGGVDDENQGGIRVGANSSVTVEDASYMISGGDIVVGSRSDFASLVHQGASLTVRQNGNGLGTNIYARGLSLNGSRMDLTGRMYIANDLVLSGQGSYVSLAGQYYGYGAVNVPTWTQQTERMEKDGNFIQEDILANPADSSSAIVINGKESTVDLTGLTALQLAGRAYIGLPQDGETGMGLPHVMTGESISVKSNQIAYLVPPECVGTLNGRTMIGQNPVSFETWSGIMGSLSEYEAQGQDFRIVDAERSVDGLGGERLDSYGILDITAQDLSGTDREDIVRMITKLNQTAAAKGVRFLYLPENRQVYLFLAMDEKNAEAYFAQYYSVDSNKARLDNYFNQYASGGIKLRDGSCVYAAAGNGMVSLTDAASNNILTSAQGENLVRLLTGTEGSMEEQEEMKEMADSYNRIYGNLNQNLSEEEAGLRNTVFENLVRLDTQPGAPEGLTGLREYLDEEGGQVEFATGEGTDLLKAVLVDSARVGGAYRVEDSRIRLVIAIGDVEVACNFQGLILASGRITVADSVTVRQDGEGVYAVLQAKSGTEGDVNVPANVLCSGSGMIMSGYEGADVDGSGNLNIDYSVIVRYENWVKK